MRHEGSGKENQRTTFSRWSISINLKIMALMCYLDDDHRERYRNSFVMFGVGQEVKELFKEDLSYDKSLLIRAYEEPIYERFLFWKYKTNEIEIKYFIYHETFDNNGKSFNESQQMSCASGNKEKVMAYLYGIINGFIHCKRYEKYIT